MKIEELEQICKLTVELTRHRQNECKHLKIEYYAPNLFNDLLERFAGVQSLTTSKG